MKASNIITLPTSDKDILAREKAKYDLNENFREIVATVTDLEERIEALEQLVDRLVASME